MKALSSNQISESIEKRTGDAGVQVHVDTEFNCCVFFNDDDDAPLHEFEDNTVYATALCDMTVEEWVDYYVMLSKIKR